MDVRLPQFSFDREGTAEYIVARRPCRSLPSTANTYDSAFGDRVCIIPIVGQGWLDCSSLKICLTVKGNAGTTNVNQGSLDLIMPSDMIERLQVYVGDDVLVEDIQYYNEACQIFSDALPTDVRHSLSDSQGVVNYPLHPDRKFTLVIAPWLLGIFKSGKYLPVDVAKVTLQLTFAKAAAVCTDAARGYTITDAYVRHDMVIVSDYFQAEFQRHWAAQKTITFMMPTLHLYIEAFANGNGATSGVVTVPVGFTNILAIIAAFREVHDEKPSGRKYPAGITPEAHAAAITNLNKQDELAIRYQWSLGSLSLPSVPVASHREAYAQWQEFAGSTAAPTYLPFGNYADDSHFVIAQRFQRCGLLSAGTNTFLGDRIRLEVNNLRNNGQGVCRVYTCYAMSVSIGAAGVSVTD